jgi:methyl-accepting chemotaxis protein
MRAADAAKNTSNLIEGTVKKVKDGSGLLGNANSAFAEVAGGADKVAQLVAEITAASNEQAQGIDQLNLAIAEMDKVVQQNAANAEESASASEEMNGQAEQMKSMVGELVVLVGGGAKYKGAGVDPQIPIGNEGKDPLSHAGSIKKSIRDKRALIPHSKEIAPDHLIPLDDKDFKNF